MIAFGCSTTSVALPLVGRDRTGGAGLLAACVTACTAGALAGALAGAVVVARRRPASEGWSALAGLAVYALSPLALLAEAPLAAAAAPGARRFAAPGVRPR